MWGWGGGGSLGSRGRLAGKLACFSPRRWKRALTSQASRDPSAHGRVRSSLIHRLVHPATIVAAQSECRKGARDVR